MATEQKNNHNWNIWSAHGGIFLHGTRHLPVIIFPKCQFLCKAEFLIKKSRLIALFLYQFTVTSLHNYKYVIILFVLLFPCILPGSSSDSKFHQGRNAYRV